MAAFGTLTLLIALVVATYAGTASVVGIRRGSRRLIESGRSAVYALAAVLGLSSVAIWYAFLTHDYSIKYVHRYSDAASPLFYQITRVLGGLDGSILWWVFLLSVFSAIAVYTNRNRHRELLPYAIAVLMTIADFFLYVIIFHKNPFSTYTGDIPTTGKGLNPLLQNAYMVTHPPSLYTGFVGMSIPFAFGMGALISGQLDDAWIASVRRWTLGAWFFLSMGLTLGMLWAYEELGWGGFWAWDPVENAGFLPWLTATAFLHSIMIQERRGMLKIWNVTLIILTFFLTIFGTFMTRSGVVQSVHAFGQTRSWPGSHRLHGADPGRQLRLRDQARTRAARPGHVRVVAVARGGLHAEQLDPAVLGVLHPVRHHVPHPVRGGHRRAHHGGPPLLQQVDGAHRLGAAVPDRRRAPHRLAQGHRQPPALPVHLAVSAAIVTAGICAWAGLGSSWAAVINFSLCAMVGTTIAQEFFRNLIIRRKNTGSDAVSAGIGMVLRNRRRYGGYVVHLGIMLMFLGFAGTAYKKEAEARLEPGGEKVVGKYRLRFDRLAHEEDRQKEMVTGEVTAFVNGKVLDHLRPARWYFHGHESEPTTEVAMHRAPAEDLYLTLGNYDLADGTIMLKVVVNPVVDWIWCGFMLLAFGTGIALLPEALLEKLMMRAPERAGSRAPRRRGPGAVRRPVAARRQPDGPRRGHGARAGRAPVASGRRRELAGAQHHLPVRKLPSQPARVRLRKLRQRRPEPHRDPRPAGAGKDPGRRDPVLHPEVRQPGGAGGSHRQGFQPPGLGPALRLGVGAVGALAYGAFRLARRTHLGTPAAATAAGKMTADPELQDQLEDELQNLD